jgi:cyclic dehypoxanthinyl futalosine synthase
MTCNPSIYTPPTEYPNFDANDPGLLTDVAAGHTRLTPEQGLQLLTQSPIHSLGRWADARCRAIHGHQYRTFVIDRNINYTNVCTATCTFCAFRRSLGDTDAYTLDHEAIYDKIAEIAALGGTQILMQGGMNPELPLDWYIDLLSGIRARFPGIHIHAFSPPEFIEFVNFFDPPGATLEDKIRFVMVRLQEAGLDSIPGGGGEIFAPAVRTKIGLGKCTAEAWLTCMFVAHTLGMFTSATMMFGHIEGHADRIHHMHLVRQWQDKALQACGRPSSPPPLPAGEVAEQSEGRRGSPSDSDRPSTGGHYTAFISWPFQRDNSPLGRVKDWGSTPQDLTQNPIFPGDAIARLDGSGTKADHPEFGRRLRMAGAVEYLRTQATSRLYLDNIYSIGASWVTMGPHIGQLGLLYGANDMGSVMLEENVVSAAGTTYCLDEAVLCRLIRDAGFTPAQRNNTYDILDIKTGDNAPDEKVTDWSTHRAGQLQTQAAQTNEAELTVGQSS